MSHIPHLFCTHLFFRLYMDFIQHCPRPLPHRFLCVPHPQQQQQQQPVVGAALTEMLAAFRSHAKRSAEYVRTLEAIARQPDALAQVCRPGDAAGFQMMMMMDVR